MSQTRSHILAVVPTKFIRLFNPERHQRQVGGRLVALWWSVAVSMALLGSTGCDLVDNGCESDADCRTGRICDQQRCRWIDETSLEPPSTANPVPAEVVGGGTHNCVRDTEGVVYCWGRNQERQAAPDLDDESVPPRRVRGIPGRAVDLALGHMSTCAALEDGAVYCWGVFRNRHGTSAGTWQFDRPTRIEGVDNAVELSGENQYACARLADGSVACWGSNSYGQFGNGERGEFNREAQRVRDISSAVEITAGRFSMCARLDSGEVRCWGQNGRSQLGDGTSEDRLRPTPVSGLPDVVDIEAGGWRTYALTADGDLYGWGNLLVDGRGGPPRGDQRTPRRIEEIADIDDISTGFGHMCALQNGAVYCWGDNHAGELGDGTEEDRQTPEVVIGLSDTSAIGVGDGHSCAIGADHKIHCWGSNRYGETSGTRDGFEVYEPVELPWPPTRQE